jgi:hypothetical protein
MSNALLYRTIDAFAKTFIAVIEHWYCPLVEGELNPATTANKRWMHCLPIIKKQKGRLSTELNATDNLSLAKHHKRTKTSDEIDTTLSSLRSPPSCSLPVPFFSLFLCTRTFTPVVVDSSSFKMEEFLHKMAISLKNCPFE